MMSLPWTRPIVTSGFSKSMRRCSPPFSEMMTVNMDTKPFRLDGATWIDDRKATGFFRGASSSERTLRRSGGRGHRGSGDGLVRLGRVKEAHEIGAPDRPNARHA